MYILWLVSPRNKKNKDTQYTGTAMLCNKKTVFLLLLYQKKTSISKNNIVFTIWEKMKIFFFHVYFILNR